MSWIGGKWGSVRAVSSSQWIAGLDGILLVLLSRKAVAVSLRTSGFELEIGHFSTFWGVFIESVDSKHISWPVSTKVGASDKSVSYSQLKLPETSCSRDFRVKMADFSIF